MEWKSKKKRRLGCTRRLDLERTGAWTRRRVQWCFRGWRSAWGAWSRGRDAWRVGHSRTGEWASWWPPAGWSWRRGPSTRSRTSRSRAVWARRSDSARASSRRSLQSEPTQRDAPSVPGFNSSLSSVCVCVFFFNLFYFNQKALKNISFFFFRLI